MVKISNRLMTAASLVSEGMILADVGTDHGYVPIYLMEQKRIPSAIAMDINEGPLERAREHITLYGMDTYIKTRLSDGVAAMKPGEADAILIAGMGGGLVMHILKDGEEVCHAAKELILQPQSELERVRAFLEEEGYEILAEDMVFEEDKFYPMMKVRYTGEALEKLREKKQDLPKIQDVDPFKLFNLYGGLLLKNQHPVLKTYLEKESMIYTDIEKNLQKQAASEKIFVRLKEVQELLRYNRAARKCFE